MTIWLQRFFVLSALILAGFAQGSNDLLAVPPLTSRVVDLTATLTSSQLTELNNNLRTFEERKGSQIAVLIVPTTKPETIEQYSIRVAEQWKIGRKKVDDGVILVVAKNDHTLRIEVGYGLEGALNDATAKRIIDDIVVPHFKQGNIYEGINAGVDSIITVVDGEPLPVATQSTSTSTSTSTDSSSFLPLTLIAVMVLGSLMCSLLGKLLGSALTGGIIGVVAWLIAGLTVGAIAAGVLGFLFTLLGGGRFVIAVLEKYGGSSGGSSSGGSSGGGFSGGGGGFGGGGASGSW